MVGYCTGSEAIEIDDLKCIFKIDEKIQKFLNNRICSCYKYQWIENEFCDNFIYDMAIYVLVGRYGKT